MLEISNDGALIRSTNYWDVAIGSYYVSCNAGAFRILLTPEAEPYLGDMRSAKGAAVSRGPWPRAGRADAFELLFDDGSDSPFALHTDARAFDRLPPDSDSGRRFVVSVWVRRDGEPHKALELPCTYRRAASIPDLRPWEET